VLYGTEWELVHNTINSDSSSVESRLCRRSPKPPQPRRRPLKPTAAAVQRVRDEAESSHEGPRGHSHQRVCLGLTGRQRTTATGRQTSRPNITSSLNLRHKPVDSNELPELS